MNIKLVSLLAASVLLVGCSSGQSDMPASEATSPDLETVSAPPPIAMSDAETVEQMVTLACETGFYSFTELSGPMSACHTFIFAVDPKGGIDPTAFQEAVALGDSEGATRAVVAAWDGTWTSWLAGATLVCNQTADGPQDATELEITLAALESMTPRLARQIYSESQAIFCPAIELPAQVPMEQPASGTLTVQQAVSSLCSEAVTNLPNLIDAGDSEYWTEVLQVLAASQRIAVGPIDGEYGPQTIAGVRELQRRIGVVDDGQVGPITWSALQVYFC